MRSLIFTRSTSGTVSVYRPEARVAQTGRYEFAITNNAPAAASVTLKTGSDEFTIPVNLPGTIKVTP